jgi:hypothetical protein
MVLNWQLVSRELGVLGFWMGDQAQELSSFSLRGSSKGTTW